MNSKDTPKETIDNSPSSERNFQAHDVHDSNVITGNQNTIDNRVQNYFVAGDQSVVTSLHQLPPPPGDFTGRKDEIDELMKALDKGGVNISGLQGQGGIGKTALALVLADMLKTRYVDAQFYLDLKGVSKQPLSAADAMSHIIRSYHPTMKMPVAESQLSALYRSTLHGKRALLVMDNAATREQVEPLTPPDGCVMLVTSRNRFYLPGLFAKNLDELSPEDARRLLTKIAPRIESHAEEIARLCGYLPLALRLAASAFAERIDLKPADYVRRLTDAKQRLKMLKDVEASLQVSYELSSEEMQKRWRSLAVFPDTFDVRGVAAVWEIESDPAQDAISEMVKYSLVDWNEKTDRYRLHDLTRLFAGEKLSDKERYAVARLHSHHYAKVMGEANGLYDKGGESLKTGLELYDLELINIQQGQSWAVTEAEGDEVAAQLCIEYPDEGYLILEIRQSPRDRIQWLDSQLIFARRLKRRKSEGYALSNLGIAQAALGKPHKAIGFHEQYLAIAREIGDRRGEGIALGNLGNAYGDLGKTYKAIEFHEQSLVIDREVGDRRGVGAALGNLGLSYFNLGQTRKAIDFYEQRLVIALEIGDRRGEGNALGNLGNAYATLGETHKAIDFFEQNLAIALEIGYRKGQGDALGSLGIAYYSLGETHKAIDFYEQALVIDREIGYRRGEGAALWNKALALDKLGDREQAIACAEESLRVKEESEDPSATKVREQLAEWKSKK